MEELRREAEMAEMRRLMAAEEHRAHLTGRVHNFVEVCWEKCVNKPGSKLDSTTETCLTNCVNRYIDTRLMITKRLAEIARKSKRP
ncbi:mitochondrial import inner membrane translocase subunit Tim8 B-like [Varanus komodoensis]|nr:mitochondrial import inner membrane translocase subunit Tim8 B-like [Varanus komodoensis]